MPASLNPARSRLHSAVAVLLVIALGLASRRYAHWLPAFLGKYPGDALWALMVYCGWGLLLPRAPALRLGVLALVTAFAVEFSQLYQAPWLNALRDTTVGHLVLGSAFSWRDLVAYTVGVALGLLAEYAVRNSHNR